MARYIIVETLISIVINMLFSLAFATLIFGGQAKVEWWGARGAVVDFIPQAFMVALMGSLVPSLITARRIRTGTLAAPSRPPRRAILLLRSLGFAVGAVILFAGGAGTIVWAAGSTWLTYPAFVAIKIAFGALVAAVVTPFALHLMLGVPGERISLP
jgi:hypothetical protein